MSLMKSESMEVAESASLKSTQHIKHDGRCTRLGLDSRRARTYGADLSPYGTLKAYPAHKGQLGFVEDYDKFYDEFEKVLKDCLRGSLTTA
jgi:hypothetical protein